MQKLLFICVLLVSLVCLHAFPFDNTDFDNYGIADQQAPDQQWDQQDLYGDMGDFGDTPDAADVGDGAGFDIFAVAAAAAAAGQTAGDVAGGDSNSDSGEVEYDAPDAADGGGGGSIGVFDTGFGTFAGNGGGMGGAGAGFGGGRNVGGFVGNPAGAWGTNDADPFDTDANMLNAGRVSKPRSNGASVGIAIATVALVIGAATVAIVVIRRQRQHNMMQSL